MMLLDKLLMHLAPHNCLGCEAEGQLLCTACRQSLLGVAPRCYRCHKITDMGRTCASCRHASKLFAVYAGVSYEGLAKQLVWRLKFASAQAAATEMAEILLDKWQLPENIVILSAPTASHRVRQRGYDQAYLLARALAHKQKVPYLTVLKRLGRQHQVGAGRVQRQAQLADAFWVIRPQLIKDCHVLLVDDVLTTGATLEAAAATLRAAGAKRVTGIVFAQA